MLVTALTLALAAQAAPASPAPAPSPAVVKTMAPLADAPAAAPRDGPIICRFVSPEGTMIGRYKECHTAKVWTRMAHAQ